MQPDPMIPIHLARPHEGPSPHAYVVLKHTAQCTHCGTLHEHTELYAKTFLRSRNEASKYITNLRRLQEPPRYNLPIRLLSRPVDRIPFCHECFTSISLAHLPRPPEDKADSNTLLSGLSRTEAAAGGARTPHDKSRAKPKPTTDDLLKL